MESDESCDSEEFGRVYRESFCQMYFVSKTHAEKAAERDRTRNVGGPPSGGLSFGDDDEEPAEQERDYYYVDGRNFYENKVRRAQQSRGAPAGRHSSRTRATPHAPSAPQVRLSVPITAGSVSAVINQLSNQRGSARRGG
jgi:hypothetical protein